MTLTCHERVRRASMFRRPDRVPIVFWNCDQASGVVLLYHLSLGVPGDGSPNAWDWAVRYCETLGRGGGYILAPAHLFQPDVPPENILAVYRAVK